MNKTRIYCLLLCSVLSVATLVAQSKAEYFIDHDPGVRNATKVSINADAAQVDVPTSGLAAGWHVLGLRALGSRASQTYTHRFFIPEQTQVTELSDVEYFLDTDPGRDNAVKVPFTTGQTAFSFDLTNTDDLSDGIHLVGVRAKYGSRWSQTYTHLFFVTHAQAATELSGVEYWLDTDPGLGNATAYDFTAGQTEFALDAVLPEDLAEGSHLLGIRARYGDNWSQTYTHLFLHTVAHNVSVVVEAVEAYWDADMANPIEVPFDQVGDTAYIRNFNFDTQALSFGVHYLSIRGKINGVWSILSRHEICKNAVPAFEILNEDICVGDEVLILDMTSDVQPETTYKWDMDSNGSAEYTDKSDIVHTYNQAGKYTITLTVQTAEGCESSYSQEIYVHAKVAPSVSIDRSKSSICAGESVTFTANAVNAGEHPVFTWLRNNTVIAGITGTTLELSDLADNDQIQVQVTGDNPCADVKTATSSVLTQRVYPLPEVEITLASVYYTDDKAFSLSAYGTPSGGTFYINDVEAKLFNPKNNPVGTYNVRYVVTNSNNCTAEAEMSFLLKEHGNATITVLSADGTMGSVTGGGTYADGTKVTLTATPNDGYHFVQWQDGVTSATREITVNGDATYTATFAKDEPEPEPFDLPLDITIDGDFSDWSSVPETAVAIAETDGNSNYTNLYLMKWAMDISNIFFYLEFEADADVVSKIDMYINTDNDPATGYNTWLWQNSAADIMYEKAYDNYSSAVPYKFDSDDQTAWAWASTGVSGTIVACSPVNLTNGHRAIEGKIIKEILPVEVTSTIRVGVYTINASWENTGCLPQHTAAGASPMLEVNLYNGVATDLFQTGIVNGSVECIKFIRNGQLYILRDSKIYTIQGMEVK